jgi:hypothetical protein
MRMFGDSNLHAFSDGVRVLRTLFTEWRRARATRRLERGLSLSVEPAAEPRFHAKLFHSKRVHSDLAA